MLTLEITIPVGSTWPTRDEINARNAVEEALDATGIGIVSGAGGGMGVMDLAFRLEDEAKVPAAHLAINEAMKTHMPNFKYTVRVC